MSSIDRTNEFFSLIEILKKHEGTEANLLVQLQRSIPNTTTNNVGSGGSSILHRASRSISEDIRSSQRRIVRLGKLAHRRGLFDDPQKEVLELTQRAKVDLAAIEGAIASLQREVISQYGNISSNGSYASSTTVLSLVLQHWTVVIEVLRALSISLARDLQNALKARSESIRDQASRRKDFVHSKWTPSAAALPLDSPLFASSIEDIGTSRNAIPSPVSASPIIGGNGSSGSSGNNINGVNSGALRRRTQGIPQPLHPHTSSNTLISGPGRPVIPTSNTSKQLPLQQQQPLQPQSLSQPQSTQPFSGRFNVPKGSTSLRSAQQLSLMHGAISREDDMREVESTIVELGTVFTQVAGLVAEQGDLIERIDADMDIASSNVEAGHTELGKYFESVKKNRGLIIRLLLVTAFVVFLFAVMKPASKRRGFIW